LHCASPPSHGSDTARPQAFNIHRATSFAEQPHSTARATHTAETHEQRARPPGLYNTRVVQRQGTRRGTGVAAGLRVRAAGTANKASVVHHQPPEHGWAAAATLRILKARAPSSLAAPLARPELSAARSCEARGGDATKQSRATGAVQCPRICMRGADGTSRPALSISRPRCCRRRCRCSR